MSYPTSAPTPKSHVSLQASSFCLYLYYSFSRYSVKYTLTACYLVVAIVSLVPAIVESAMPRDSGLFGARSWLAALISTTQFSQLRCLL